MTPYPEAKKVMMEWSIIKKDVFLLLNRDTTDDNPLIKKEKAPKFVTNERKRKK